MRQEQFIEVAALGWYSRAAVQSGNRPNCNLALSGTLHGRPVGLKLMLP
jgi:hypothetical protein